MGRGARLPLAVAFGLTIRDARVRADWTQEELADPAGVHMTYVSDLERGLKSPTLDVVEKLAAALGTAAHRLVAAAEGQAG